MYIISAPWNLTNALVCNEMTNYKKNDYPTEQLRIPFYSHLHIHAGSHILYSDGSNTEDGVGYAVVGRRVAVSGRIQHEASISTAELCALYDGIRHCQGVGQPAITLITDSLSSIQAHNKYNSSNPLLQKMQCACATINKPITLCWLPSRVGVRGNEIADTEARRIATDGDVDPIDIPRSDIKCCTKKVLSSVWNQQWREMAGNKLREISDSTISFPNGTSGNREWERALNRLRIGHSMLTHGFLMEARHPPLCDDCIVPLTIKHILTECPNFYNERLTYFNTINLTMKFMLIDTDTSYNGTLYKFVKSINLLRKL